MERRTEMKTIVLKGRKVYGGVAEGEALVSKSGIALCAGVDPHTGEITERGHHLKGQNVAGKILVLPFGKGSSAFSKFAYGLKLAGNAPLAWIVRDINPQTALASLAMQIPAVTALDTDPLEVIADGDRVRVDGDAGTVEVFKN
jgi:predicted aconitase with swiveling domain